MKKVMVTGIFMLCAMGMFSQAKIDKLPKIGQDFLNQHFSTLTVQHVESNSAWEIWEDDMYEVKFSNGMEIDFDKNGNVLEIQSNSNESIPIAALPSEVASYLSKNYPEASLLGWEKNSKGQEIELTDGTEIEFDKDGNFIRFD